MSFTRGVKNIRFLCSASTADTKSRAASDFNTKPRAPASRASRMTWSESVMVRTITFCWGFCCSSCRVAANPLRLGIPTSSITTSGFNCFAISTASRPSLASPQISQPSCDWRRAHSPRRTTSWSSAIRIRNFIAHLREGKQSSGNNSNRVQKMLTTGWKIQVRLAKPAATVWAHFLKSHFDSRMIYCKKFVLAHRLDGCQQISSRLGLYYETPGARCHSFAHHLRRVMLRHHQNLRLRHGSPNAAASFPTIHSRHAHVEQNNIRLQAIGFFQCFQSIFRFVDNLPLGANPEQGP